MKIQCKRIYDAASADDGYRVLVDRLWPRGVSKEKAAIDEWAKNLAPSAELRREFAHDPERFDEFRQRYRRELDDRRDRVDAFLERCSKKTVTLLFAAKDESHNHALVLKEFFEAITN